MMMGFGVLVVVVFVVIVWQLINQTDNTNTIHKRNVRQDILDECYANGEITREEY